MSAITFVRQVGIFSKLEGAIRRVFGVMETDTLRMRGKRPFVFTNLKSGEGVAQIASFVIDKGGLARSAA